MKYAKIPPAAINRLSIYRRRRKISSLSEGGLEVISSERLARACGVNAAQLRKDLAYFGEFGVRGVGYYTAELLKNIKQILGCDKEWRLGLFGVGNLGQALFRFPNFLRQGYRFVAAFDSNPLKIGRPLGTGLIISDVKETAEVVRRELVEIAVITTPADEAQGVADLAIASGVKGILNFAPVLLGVPDHVSMENVDFTIRLDSLSYFLTHGMQNFS